MSSDVRANQRIGNYLLIEKIGQGAFSEVWKAAHHEQHEKLFAIKLATNAEYRRQLAREARWPGHQIQHRNIVPVVDSDTYSQPPYVVMPYYPNGSLADLMQRNPKGLAETRVEAILRQVLAGLSAAHEAGVVHRDIKPSNILFLDVSEEAAIADFGLCAAQEWSAESLRQSLSVSGSREIGGTLAYMAPEAIHGEAPTPMTDIYSIGILLFEMLSGRLPQGLELPGETRPHIGRGSFWDAITYWCLRPKNDRYPDGRALLAAFHEGPRPIPLGQPKVADAIAGLPEPTPLPADEWDAVAARWEERARHHTRLKQIQRFIKDASKIYAERHPVVQQLMEEQRAVQVEQERMHSLVIEACDAASKSIQSSLAPLLQARERLLAEGCLQSHPDVVEADGRIEHFEKLRGQCESLPASTPGPVSRSKRGQFASNQLLRCLEEWIRVRQSQDPEAVRRFIKEDGSDPMNPWGHAAHRLLDELKQQTCASGSADVQRRLVSDAMSDRAEQRIPRQKHDARQPGAPPVDGAAASQPNVKFNPMRRALRWLIGGSNS